MNCALGVKCEMSMPKTCILWDWECCWWLGGCCLDKSWTSWSKASESSDDRSSSERPRLREEDRRSSSVSEPVVAISFRRWFVSIVFGMARNDSAVCPAATSASSTEAVLRTGCWCLCWFVRCLIALVPGDTGGELWRMNRSNFRSDFVSTWNEIQLNCYCVCFHKAEVCFSVLSNHVQLSCYLITLALYSVY